MRFGNKHGEWTGYLTREEYALYLSEMNARKWCAEQLKKHEAKLFRLERTAKARRSEVKRAMEAAE